MPAPATVEAYLAALTPEQRAGMEQVRAAVRAGAPEAPESIAYGMPALRVDGHFLVSYAAYKRHFSLFPASDAVIQALGAELEPHLKGSGTIQFPADRPIPTDLITRIVRIRLDEEAAVAATRTARPRTSRSTAPGSAD